MTSLFKRDGREGITYNSSGGQENMPGNLDL